MRRWTKAMPATASAISELKAIKQRYDAYLLFKEMVAKYEDLEPFV